MVDQARKRNPEARIWSLLGAGWETLLADARAQVQAAEDGQPYQRHALVRARQLAAIAESASPEKVTDHALAMVLLWQQEPRAFASDDAFRAQMARRIRLLAPRLSKGTYWNDKLRRVSTVVQELPPKVALGLGQQLIDLFGPAGIRLAQLERERVPPEEAKRRTLQAALEELQ